MNEQEALDTIRQFATAPEARGLLDDVALFEGLVLTHDTIAEGVHFLPEDPPASVGWKLVAVNLSDLAAKGAAPAVALLSLTISSHDDWVASFLSGIEAACESYGLALVGGDTIALPPGAPQVFGLTAIGRAGSNTPMRSGGQEGDRLWLVGPVGDSAAGFAQLTANPKATGPLVDIYRRPIPLIQPGRAIAPHAHAMMDVSDGLLLDATRLAQASGCSAMIDLSQLPLSDSFVRERGDSLDERLFAATGGDDYALLAALPPDLDPAVSISLPSGTSIHAIGHLGRSDTPLVLSLAGQRVDLPETLGHEHHGNPAAPMADWP